MKTREYAWWHIMVGQTNSFAWGVLVALKLSHVVEWSWFVIMLPWEWPLALLVGSLSIIVLVKAYRENT